MHYILVQDINEKAKLLVEKLVGLYDMADVLDFYTSTWVAFVKGAEFKNIPSHVQKEYKGLDDEITSLETLVTSWVLLESFIHDWRLLTPLQKFNLIKLSPTNYITLRTKVELSDIEHPIYPLLNIQAPSEFNINPNVFKYAKASLGFPLLTPQNLMQAEKMSRQINSFLAVHFPLLRYSPDFKASQWQKDIFFLSICKDFMPQIDNQKVTALDLNRVASIEQLAYMYKVLNSLELISPWYLNTVLFFSVKEKSLEKTLFIQKEKQNLVNAIDEMSIPLNVKVNIKI